MAMNRSVPPCPIGFNDEYRQRKIEPRYSEPTLSLFSRILSFYDMYELSQNREY